MNAKRGFAQSAGVWSAVLLCCNTLAPAAVALDNEGPKLLLHVDGGAVSADIRAKPLVEVARALEMKTSAKIRFQTSQVKDQAITVQFENLALDAALQAILKNTSYAMIAGPTEQGAGIQVYVYRELPKEASNDSPLVVKTDVARQKPDPESQFAGTRPEDPTELPAPPEVFNPDPAVRVGELQGAVASYGPQSLPLVLAAAQDPDASVRAASEQLLLNDLRDVIPREDLSMIALRSERRDIRMQALEALAKHHDRSYARMTLDSGLRDPDPEVQQRAKDLLLELSEPESASTR